MTTEKWECTDKYLDVVPLGDNKYLITGLNDYILIDSTGRTNHFTNFGVLLGDPATKESNEQSDSTSKSGDDSANYLPYAIAGVII